MPDSKSTRYNPDDLIDTWVRTKVRNVTDNEELTAPAGDNSYSIQFKADRTFINFDGQNRSNGTWMWKGNDIVLDGGRQTITILTVGDGYLTW